jgi:3-deoxy-D-manno-octulosonic-acid transferase
VVNVVGKLADIYAVGDVAYVGGGFRSGGLHSVSEPAAFAIPVIVGPRYEYSNDATLLAESGGAFPLQQALAAAHLRDICRDLLTEPIRRADSGLSARRVLQQGAASVTTAALVHLLRQGTAG